MLKEEIVESSNIGAAQLANSEEATQPSSGQMEITVVSDLSEHQEVSVVEETATPPKRPIKSVGVPGLVGIFAGCVVVGFSMEADLTTSFVAATGATAFMKVLDFLISDPEV